MHPVRAAVLLMGVVLLAACGGDPSPGAAGSPSGSADVAPTTGATVAPSAAGGDGSPTGTTAGAIERRDGTRYGIAGLIPPNFPDSTDRDWLTFFQALPELGGTVGNYSQIGDLQRNHEVALTAGVEVLPVTGFHQDADGGVSVTVDFADPPARAAFVEQLVAFVEAYQPLYLGVGNEVNRVWEDAPDAFAAWVEALPGIVAAVHDASPETQVFATFQYEFLTGRDAIAGGLRIEDWTAFDLVEPHLDLVAFTSYPYFNAEAPDALPDDYYAPIRDHTDRPVGFTELGWPSGPIAPLEGSAVAGLGGTPEEQAGFIGRLPALVREVAPRFMMWVWAYDSGVVGPTFDSLGLHDTAGEPKPSLDAWRALVSG